MPPQHTDNPSVIFQLILTDSTGAASTVVTDDSWLAFDGDAHRKPGPATDGGSAGTRFLEYIDARGEPVGWRAAGFTPGPGWGPAVGTAPSASDLANLYPRMQVREQRVGEGARARASATGARPLSSAHAAPPLGL
jgi:hypothetical protein